MEEVKTHVSQTILNMIKEHDGDVEHAERIRDLISVCAWYEKFDRQKEIEEALRTKILNYPATSLHPRGYTFLVEAYLQLENM